MKKDLPPDFLTSWEDLHAAYPGWVFPSRTVRDEAVGRLETNREFLDFCTKEDHPGHIRIRLLAEAAWWLKVSGLLPPDEMIFAMAKAARQIDPFSDAGRAAIRATIAPSESSDLERVQEDWLLVAAELAAHYRRCVDRRFWSFCGRVKRRTSNRPKPQWLWYEECLWSLALLDLPTLRKTLNDWRPHEVQWLLRASGIALEIGHFEYAERALATVIEAVRNEQASTEGNLQAKSIEAWALFLLESTHVPDWALPIEAGNDLKRNPPQTQRIFELRREGFDPEGDLREIREALAAEIPDLRTVREQNKRVFGGRLQYSVHFRQTWLSMRPAYAGARVIEEVALPIKIRRTFNIGVGQEIYGRTASWLVKTGQHEALWFVLRCLDEKEFREDILCEHWLAALPNAQAHALFRDGRAALDRWLARPAAGVKAHIDEWPLEASFEFVSRFACRARDQDLMVELGRMVELLHTADPKGPLARHVEFPSYVARLIDAAPQDMLAPYLERILSAPIRKPDHRWDWPEPARFVQNRRDLFINGTRVKWLSEEIFGSLIGPLSGNDGEIASLALWRLLILTELGQLSHEQSSRLGQIVWAGKRVHGLPEGFKVLPHAFLKIPAPSGIDAVSAICEFFSQAPLPLDISVNQGAKTVTIHHGTEASPSGWLHSLCAFLESSEPRPIVLHHDEIMLLLGQLDRIFDTQAIPLLTMKGDSSFRNFGTMRIFHLVQTVWLLALRAPDQIAPISEQVEVWRKRLVKIGGDDTFVYVLHCALVGHDRDAARDALRRATVRDMESGTELFVDSLVRGTRLAKVLGREAPPADLWVDVATMIMIRRRPGLAKALKSMAAAVRAIPDSIPVEALERLSQALPCIEEETRYRVAPNPGERWEEYREVPFERAAAAALASALREIDLGDRTEVKEFLDAIKNDPLPMVRRAVTNLDV